MVAVFLTTTVLARSDFNQSIETTGVCANCACLNECIIIIINAALLTYYL